VIFSIQHYVGNEVIQTILERQPVAVYLELTRACVLDEPTIPLTWQTWAWGVGWAVVFAVGGFLYFWRGEERYGRD
jgi:teichoic acid transport system permease protein